MNHKPDSEIDEKLKAWVKQQLNEAVQELISQGIFQRLLIEAKPAWVYPYQILIGKIRERESGEEFSWFICGDLPTAHLHSSQASSPRAAARHFALQWQLDAARQQEGGQDLVEKAEALYELVNEDSLWLSG
jgi:hypothetical protein